MTDPPIRQQVMKYLAEQFPRATLADHQLGADGLLAIFDAEAARVCVEAVAEWAQIVAVIEQYLPEALPFNSLSEIVGGIARQRDLQHELKDHLAEVARRLTDERDAAVARAVADERREAFTRAAGLLQTEAAFQERQAGEHEFQRDARRFAIQRLRLCERILRDQAAGSVPVATGPGTIVRRVATPTEPDPYDPQRLAVLCAEAIDESASPVPAEQPEGR